MEIDVGTDSQLQHSEKTEVEQKHEPLDDSEPSNDSTNPSFDSSQASEGSSKPSNDRSGQSSEDSRLSRHFSGSPPTSEISESQLSESEYSSSESVQKVQLKKTVKHLNQTRNKNVANIEEYSINKTSTGEQMPWVLDGMRQQLDSSMKGVNDCGRLPTENLHNNKITLETACDVSKPTLKSSVDESKFSGRSDSSFSGGSTAMTSLNLARKSLYPNLRDCEQITNNQDLTGSTSMNQVDDNLNTLINQDNSKTPSQDVGNTNTTINQDNSKTPSQDVGNIDTLINEDNSKTSSQDVGNINATINQDNSKTSSQDVGNINTTINQDNSKTPSQDVGNINTTINQDNSKTSSQVGDNINATINQDNSKTSSQVGDNINATINQDNCKTSSQVGDNINATINQDNCKTTTDEFAGNINNSSLSTHSNDPVLGPQLHGSKSVSSSEQGKQRPCIYVIFLIISVVTGIGVHYYSSYTPTRNDSSLDKFSTYVREIKPNFPSQNHKFWKTFEASTRRILKKEVSKYPAVVLMASSQKHASVALCLARNISSAFDSSTGLSSGSSLIDFKDYKHLTAAEQKIHLDTALNSALSTNKRKSFVLENLQFLDPLAAIIFYNYCDNDYAPFKDVLIILTLYFDDEKESIDDSEAVENYLERIWNKGLDIDKVKPLLSRVANHIVIVQGEHPKMSGGRCL